VAWLRTPEAIRVRCAAMLAAGREGRLGGFAVDLARLPALADYVVAVIRERYPTLEVPYHSRWGHFRAGGVDRIAELEAGWAGLDRDERARRQFDLVVTSVLLDAGAGPDWRYRDGDGAVLSRSEGLAVASLRMVQRGELAGDAATLEACDAARLAAGFQVGPDNPLVGLDGRAALLRNLGAALRASPALFGDPPRIGHLYDRLRAGAGSGPVAAPVILAALLDGLAPIWPGRITLAGANLGDVWPHPAAGGSGPSAGLVPFHKLSQWLTYSLIEPLGWAGVAVTEVDQLTGLAEYRNGGLFVDGGVLVPLGPEVTAGAHAPGDPVVVEWRALTVALLDRIADLVRARLGRGPDELPLARVLEGGTWAAGRKMAAERRPGGPPPLAIDSDGTVF